MELRIIFPLLSMFSSGFIHTAVPAALSEASLTRHSRTKRCSCSTFLDKECVYFCHLDIIWVNTPERTVSYGLGSAPRKKRSVEEASLSTELPRCVCTDSSDGMCLSFCHKIKLLRYKAARDKVIPTASGHNSAEKQSKYDLAAKNLGIKRAFKNPAPSDAKARRQLPLLLQKWRAKWPQKEQILPNPRHVVLDLSET